MDNDAQELKKKHGSLKELPYVQTQTLTGNLNGESLGRQKIPVSQIVATPQLRDWSHEYHKGFEEEGLSRVESTALKLKRNEEVDKIYSGHGSKPIELTKLEGPKGPIYAVDEGSHRVAASKLAGLDTIPAEVEDLTGRTEIPADNESQVLWWQALLKSGAVKGKIVEEKGQTFLKLEKAPNVPWIVRPRTDFVKINKVYEQVYGEGSLSEAPVPQEILLDSSQAMIWENKVLADKQTEISSGGPISGGSSEQIAVTLNPKTAPQAVSKKVKDFQTSVDEAGYFELEREEAQELKALDVLPPDFQGPELPAAMHLYAKGADGEKLSDTASRLAFLGEGPRRFLQRTAYLMGAFKEASVRKFPTIQEVYDANQQPEITISEVPQTHTPEPNQLLFSRTEGLLKPILKEGVGRAANLAKDKLKDFAIKAIKKGGKKLIKEGAKLAVKAGLLAAEAAVSATGVGAVLVIAEKVISWAKKGISYLKRGFSKLLQWITGEKDTKKAVFATSALLLVGGFFIPGTLGVLAVGAGALGTVTSGASIVGGKAVASGVKGAVQTLTYGIATATTPYLVPFFAAIIIIPFIFAIILFIINSGAYVVPPSPFAGSAFLENPYIGVVKEADPGGPFDNSDLTQTITYTITVTAKQSTLSNIVFNYSCEVIADYNQSCPPIENVTVNGVPVTSFTSINDLAPNIISAGQDFVITYEQEFSSGSYEDSAIVDSLTVTADTPEQTGTTATGSKSIIFGNPPTGCFTLANNISPWPADYEAAMLGAIAHITSNHAAYATRVCGGGEVPLCFDNRNVGYWGFHQHSSSCDIVFYQGNWKNTLTNSSFILGHESAHHLANIDGSLYSNYLSYCSSTLSACISSERNICSYPLQNSPGEDFAEAIGVYINHPTYWASSCGAGTSLQSLYPVHYEFVDQIVF